MWHILLCFLVCDARKKSMSLKETTLVYLKQKELLHVSVKVCAGVMRNIILS